MPLSNADHSHDGQLLFCEGDPTIWQIINGTKRRLPTWNDYLNLGSLPYYNACDVLAKMPEYYEYYYDSLYGSSLETATCTQLKSIKLALDLEEKNMDKRRLPGGDLANDGYYQQAMVAFTNIQSKFNARYATMDCDNAIVQQQTTQAANILNDASVKANTALSSNNIGNYIIYGIVGLIVVSTIAFGLKKMNQKPA